MTRRIRCSICNQLHEKENIRKRKNGKYICTECIDGINFIECEDCRIVEEKLLDTIPVLYTVQGGKRVCLECLESRYLCCSECEEYVHINNLTAQKNDNAYLTKIVCDECIEDKYYICEICGGLERNTNLQITKDTLKKVCRTCADRRYRCTCCGSIYEKSDNIETDYRNNHICNECIQENYTECDRCSSYVRTEELTEDEDEYLCPICMEQEASKIILSYHSNTEYEYKKLDKENTKEYFGIELEVAGEKRFAKQFRRITGEKDIVLMKDSSVSGFEIITMPMTYGYLTTVFRPNLEKGLQYLIANDFSGHNKGGMHIHISEAELTKLQIAQISAILYGNNNDRKTWLKLSQRREAEITRWCSMSNGYPFYQITDNQSEYPVIGTSRYTALNRNTRTSTYEFRIFNSNLRIERVMKNIQITKAILDYTFEHRNNERPVCNTTGLLEYILGKRLFYPDAAAFIDETKIYEQHISKEYTLEEVA